MATRCPSARSTFAGGAWRFVNRHPRGEAAFYGVYRDIAARGRLVFTGIYEPFPDAESVVTSVFTEEKGKTASASRPAIRRRTCVTW